MKRKVADLDKRIAGGLIDLFIITLLPFIMLILLGQKTPLQAGFDPANSPIGLFVSVPILTYIIFAIMEAIWGKTPGKFIVNTRVVCKDGRKIHFGHSLVRNIIRLVDMIGFYVIGVIFIATTRYKQRLGDMFAGTVVVFEGFDIEYENDETLPEINVHDS